MRSPDANRREPGGPAAARERAWLPLLVPASVTEGPGQRGPSRLSVVAGGGWADESSWASVLRPVRDFGVLLRARSYSPVPPPAAPRRAAPGRSGRGPRSRRTYTLADDRVVVDHEQL